MGLLARKLRTPDKWFRVNEIVRHNAPLKTALNGDATIQGLMENNLGIVNSITTTYGLPNANQGDIPTKKANAFPMTKGMWMGTLALDVYVDGPEDRKVPLNAKNFAANSALIRKRANRIIAAFRIDEDVYNKSDDGNPGGQVASA